MSVDVFYLDEGWAHLVVFGDGHAVQASYADTDKPIPLESPTRGQAFLPWPPDADQLHLKVQIGETTKLVTCRRPT